MNSPRNLLLIALLFISYLLWMEWQKDYGQPPAEQASSTAPATPAAQPPADIPEAAAPAAPAPEAATAGGNGSAAPASQRVVVTTDVLRVEIDTRGGSVAVADLLDYPEDTGDPTPVRLFDDRAATYFEAQSGLVSATGPAPDHQAIFQAEQTEYRLAEGADTLEVPLTWTDPSGLGVRKVFTFQRGSYVIDQRQDIDNASSQAWAGNAYRQLQRVPPVLDTSGIKGYANTARYSFAGAAIYSPEDKFEKLKFDNFAKEPLDKSFAGGWAAMLQHYFFAAWIPPADETDQYVTRILSVDGSQRYLIRTLTPPIQVAPGASATESARLYVGPKLQSTLGDIAPGLALTVDYGMLTVISEPLHWILAQFHKLTGNWGFAIILLVLLIKAVFFKLSEAQYRSMAKMRKLQPRIAALKERYGDDRQKMNTAMMELYKKEKANPLAGCLPMLIQIPVFFALYWVLLESVELRQAPFVGWIQNLTAPDPYYVLPVLNGLIMVATQFLTPMAGMDPTQAKMMKIMPVIFAVVFAFFPAGLVLYYTVNGGLSLLQQWIITRRIEGGQKARA
ncbi:MAG: membrane protein insertase YidC [Xanthomonadales bacterium]|nr:membrane protein insertase YidC [Xanthomonadales bacterium]